MFLFLSVLHPSRYQHRPLYEFSTFYGPTRIKFESSSCTLTFVFEQVAQQHKKALEEDPTAFDYDGVYDEMKGNQARPIQEDRARREVTFPTNLFHNCMKQA